jgi:signal transduction histidine kinase
MLLFSLMTDSVLPALLALASHELRQPTGVVRGHLRALDKDPTVPQRHRKAVEEAAGAADRIVALLDEIGELATIREGNTPLTLKSMSLRSVLNQSVQAVELPASHDVELDVVAPGDVRMRVDEARLRAAICTLIAVLARAQRGPATIDLRLSKRAGWATIVITPRSLGRGKIVDEPLDLSRGGNGLLLPIAESIIEAHGGKLRERWMAGRWSGFVVKL